MRLRMSPVPISTSKATRAFCRSAMDERCVDATAAEAGRAVPDGIIDAEDAGSQAARSDALTGQQLDLEGREAAVRTDE